MSRQCLPVLLTRPEEGSVRFAARLKGHVVRSPLLKPRFLEAHLPRAEGLVLTSAVAIMALRGARPALRAWCVGDRTAEVARKAGFDACSAQGDAEALFRLILDSGENGPLLHPRGRESRGDLGRRLTTAGIPTTEAILYEMIPHPLSSEARALLDGPVVVPLFSPASARRFLEVAGGARPVFACLSEAVAAVLPPDAARHVAARPDAAAMVELVTLLQRLETSPVQS
ncbi:uroporphyrinogen-III synthase [Falsirhodobacter sp. 1013]|uniref:uroporphyrinogen-III synthase n=1 Tax=Falsirhodobacter sp. 1013 TaxID=3417566 RepID=UPI003EBB69F1